jgi:hypothetical protein
MVRASRSRFCCRIHLALARDRLLKMPKTRPSPFARADAVTGKHHGRLGCQQPENDRS